MPDLDRLLRDRLTAATPASTRTMDDVRATARWRRARRRACVAGGLACVAAGGAALVLSLGSTAATVDHVADPGSAASTPSRSPGTTTAVVVLRTGAVGYDRTTSAISCVEEYTPAHVTGRGFAFDGVVTAIGPSVSAGGGYASMGGLAGVTFDVRHWYGGGSADTTTVDLAEPGSHGEDGSNSLYEVGTRILVSGESLARKSTGPLDHPYAWGCGFTRYWDEQTAADWADAFAR